MPDGVQVVMEARGRTSLSSAGADDAASRQPTVLIATTTWWAFPARIAMQFHRAGFRVEAICPKQHPLLLTRCVARSHRYAALRPLDALSAAIRAARADLIVPCDDRVAEHLHRLHAASAPGPIADVIEKSLGDPSSFPLLLDRSRFIALAREAGIRAPDMVGVADAAALDDAIARVGLPAVMKIDGTWGGLGVLVLATTQQIGAAWREATRKLTAAKALKRRIVNRDSYHLLPWLLRDQPRVSLQHYVTGQPANSIVACDKGEVLSLTSAEVVVQQRELGAAAVVRIIDHAEMRETAERLVRRLGLSGFVGFDFLLDEETGAAHLLEINPRSTPLCHLALGAGRDPVAALAARVSGRALVYGEACTRTDIIAYFPQAWHLDAANPMLREGYHDVPWDEPDLLRELLRVPRPDRGLLAEGLSFLQRAIGRPQGGLPNSLDRPARAAKPVPEPTDPTWQLAASVDVSPT